MGDTENDCPSLVLSYAHKMHPPQAIPPAQAYSLALAKSLVSLGPHQTSQLEALLQRGPLNPSPERYTGHGEGSSLTWVP